MCIRYSRWRPGLEIWHMEHLFVGLLFFTVGMWSCLLVAIIPSVYMGHRIEYVWAIAVTREIWGSRSRRGMYIYSLLAFMSCTEYRATLSTSCFMY